jgi:hypothetical protein
MDSKYFSDLLDDLKIIFKICIMNDNERKHINLSFDNEGATLVGTNLINSVAGLNNKIAELSQFKKEVDVINTLLSNHEWADSFPKTDLCIDLAGNVDELIYTVTNSESEVRKLNNDLKEEIERSRRERERLQVVLKAICDGQEKLIQEKEDIKSKNEDLQSEINQLMLQVNNLKSGIDIPKFSVKQTVKIKNTNTYATVWEVKRNYYNSEFIYQVLAAYPNINNEKGNLKLELFESELCSTDIEVTNEK